jgi:hypothetical protein
MSLFTFDIFNTKAKWIDTQPSLHEIMVVYVSMAPGPFRLCVFHVSRYFDCKFSAAYAARLVSDISIFDHNLHGLILSKVTHIR